MASLEYSPCGKHDHGIRPKLIKGADFLLTKRRFYRRRFMYKNLTGYLSNASVRCYPKHPCIRRGAGDSKAFHMNEVQKCPKRRRQGLLC